MFIDHFYFLFCVLLIHMFVHFSFGFFVILLIDKSSLHIMGVVCYFLQTLSLNFLIWHYILLRKTFPNT